MIGIAWELLQLSGKIYLSTPDSAWICEGMEYSVIPVSKKILFTCFFKARVFKPPGFQPSRKMSQFRALPPFLSMTCFYSRALEMISQSNLHARYAHFRAKSNQFQEIQQPWKIEKSMQKLAKVTSTKSDEPKAKVACGERRKQVVKLEKRGKKQQHFWKRKIALGSGKQARLLVNTVMPLSNVKEEIYGALDEWVAFQQEFPIIAVRQALKFLKDQGQWQRVIQVSKWMLSKGQIVTFSIYEIMLKAFDMDGRLEEAEVLWEKLISKYTRSVPRSMFGRMISMYVRHEMLHKVIEVTRQMEQFGVKPDEGLVKKIAQVYMQMGMEKKVEALAQSYPIVWEYYQSGHGNSREKSRVAEDQNNKGENCNNSKSGDGATLLNTSDKYEKLTSLIIDTM